MTQTAPIPEVWVGREAHVRYVDAPRSINCTITEVNDRSVCAVAGDETSFFPWGSVIRIDLGHNRLAQERWSR